MKSLSLFVPALLAALAIGCGSADDGAGGDPDTSPRPAEEMLPVASGECPGFSDGAGCTVDATSMICTFKPAGIQPRPVRIWMSDRAREADGVTIVYWHGLGGSAGNAARQLGPAVQAIVDEGGILISPERSEKRQMVGILELPWLLALPSTEEQDDLLVMDEAIACAHAKLGIDVRRIHTTGMSAGGLQVGQVGARRSGYLASTVVFSGGQLGEPPIQDPNNKYAVALFHGGPQDIVALNFMDQELAYRDKLTAQGHFSILCNHGGGHTVPPEAASGGWQFIQDHPYGVAPEPYANGIPGTLPAYCER